MIIHLGDETRAEVIDSVLGQLSDGIWENRPSYNKYWEFAVVDGTDLEISDESSMETGRRDRYGNRLGIVNAFHGKSEQEIKNWFANKAKEVVKIWAEDNRLDPKAVWNRANDDDIIDYMGGHKVPTITVADVYECYDFLKGRSGKKYGIAADPLPYEVECSTRRTFTKYPSNYVKASTSNIKYIQSEWNFAPDDYDYSLPLPRHIGFCGYGGRSWVDINSNGIDTWNSCEEAVEDAKKNYKPDTYIYIYKIDMDTRTILENCEEVHT